MASNPEMEEVSMEELLNDIDNKPVLFERDETGRWIENPAFTTASRHSRITYSVPPSGGSSYVYSTAGGKWELAWVE